MYNFIHSKYLKGMVNSMEEIKATNCRVFATEVDYVYYHRIPIITNIIGPNDQIAKVLIQTASNISNNEESLFFAKTTSTCTKQLLTKISDLDDLNPDLSEKIKMLIREVRVFKIPLVPMVSLAEKEISERGCIYQLVSPIVQARNVCTPNDSRENILGNTSPIFFVDLLVKRLKDTPFGQSAKQTLLYPTRKREVAHEKV